MKKPFGCFLPLNALAVHPQGEQKFCLTSSAISQPDAQGFLAQRMEIHDQLSQGQWPVTCKSCRLQEEQGLQSRRIKTWERKSQIYGTENLVQLSKEQTTTSLRHLEISFSNICNLQCAMCSSEFSSSWIARDTEARQQGLEFRNFTSGFQKIRRVSEATLQEFLNRAHEIDLLIIKGGEPTRDPLCLDFLNKLAQSRTQNLPNIFIQTNGTRDPREWLPQLSGLQLEVGFSIDGWGPIYEWIRDTSFDQVLEHFLYLDEQPQVKSLSIDFTLSAFNCFHFPEFLEKVLELKLKVKKLDTCPFFQWAQEGYARPDNINFTDRTQILAQAKPLLESNPTLFVNYKNILKVLTLEQCSELNRSRLRRWIDYVNNLRGHSLYDLEPALRSSF